MALISLEANKKPRFGLRSYEVLREEKAGNRGTEYGSYMYSIPAFSKALAAYISKPLRFLRPDSPYNWGLLLEDGPAFFSRGVNVRLFAFMRGDYAAIKAK